MCPRLRNACVAAGWGREGMLPGWGTATMQARHRRGPAPAWPASPQWRGRIWALSPPPNPVSGFSFRSAIVGALPIFSLTKRLRCLPGRDLLLSLMAWQHPLSMALSPQSVLGSMISVIPRSRSQDSPPTQFSSSSFRGSVSSSTSSFAFPFFLPFPFPLPPLVVAVGGFFSLSVTLLPVEGARLPRGCRPQQAQLGKNVRAGGPKTTLTSARRHTCTHVYPCTCQHTHALMRTWVL